MALKNAMARIKDIAQIAGVSEATVSRVLNKTVPVNIETEQKVRDAIEKARYRPNMLAKGLRQQSGKLIGLIVPSIHHPTFSLITSHVEKYTRMSGLNLIIGNTGSDPETESQIINDMLDRKVNGIITLRVSNKSHATEVLENYDVPFVLLDRAQTDSPFSYVMTDNHAAGKMAAGYLYDKGHRDIVCVTGPMDVSVVNMRLAGFTEELNKKDCQLPPGNIYQCDFTFDSGRQIAEQIIQDHGEITAIWAQNDPMALGLMYQYMKLKYTIPRDISIMGMDDIELSSQYIPGLTTIRQPFEEMCRIAVSYISEPELRQQKQVLLTPALVERESVTLIQQDYI